jgi:hypothetical protein
VHKTRNFGTGRIIDGAGFEGTSESILVRNSVPSWSTLALEYLFP